MGGMLPEAAGRGKHVAMHKYKGGHGPAHGQGQAGVCGYNNYKGGHGRPCPYGKRKKNYSLR